MLTIDQRLHLARLAKLRADEVYETGDLDRWFAEHESKNSWAKSCAYVCPFSKALCLR